MKSFTAWFSVSVLSEVGGETSERGHLQRWSGCPRFATTQHAVVMGATGSDVALETADVALMADDLNKLVFALGLACRTRSLVRQNLGPSAVVIGALIKGAVSALLSLSALVVAQRISEFLVSSSRLRRHRG